MSVLVAVILLIVALQLLAVFVCARGARTRAADDHLWREREYDRARRQEWLVGELEPLVEFEVDWSWPR